MNKLRWTAVLVVSGIMIQLFVYCCFPRNPRATSEANNDPLNRPEPVGWVFGRVIGVSDAPKSSRERSRFTPGPTGAPRDFAR